MYWLHIKTQPYPCSLRIITTHHTVPIDFNLPTIMASPAQSLSPLKPDIWWAKRQLFEKRKRDHGCLHSLLLTSKVCYDVPYPLVFYLCVLHVQNMLWCVCMLTFSTSYDVCALLVYPIVLSSMSGYCVDSSWWVYGWGPLLQGWGRGRYAVT